MSADTKATQDLVLQQGCSATDQAAPFGALAGVVLARPSGRPIPGAELSFLHRGTLHSVETDATGQFRLAAPETGRFELAYASAEGFLEFAPGLGTSSVVFEARAGQRVDGVTVFLNELVPITGRVLDDEGRPLAAARVRYQGSNAGAATSTELGDTETDATGAFTFRAPADGWLVASYPDHLEGTASLAGVRAAVTITLTLRQLASGAGRALVSGRVEGSDGSPIEGAAVWATPVMHRGREGRARQGFRVVTGLDGRFALPVIVAAEARYRLVAEHRSYATVSQVVGVPLADPVVLRMGRGGSLTGQVRQARDHRPVPAFAVLLRPQGGIGRESTTSFFDADGRFEVNGLNPGTWRLRVAAYGFATSEELTFTIPPDLAQVMKDVELEAGGRVFGVVQQAHSGTPIGGASLTVEGGFEIDEEAVSVQASALSDAQGRFSLAGLAAGLRSLRVAADGYNTRMVSGVLARADGDLGPLTIELTPVDPGHKPKTEMVGIGASLAPGREGFRVVNVLPDGGAERVGMQAGDLILAIDGVALAGAELADVVEKIRGEEGSVIRLRVRHADGREDELSVVRRQVTF